MKNPVKKNMDKLRKPATHRDQRKYYRPCLSNTAEIEEYLEYVLEEKAALKDSPAPKSRKKISRELTDEVVRLDEAGFTVRQITKRTGVNKSRSSVGRIVKQESKK